MTTSSFTRISWTMWTTKPGHSSKYKFAEIVFNYNLCAKLCVCLKVLRIPEEEVAAAKEALGKHSQNNMVKMAQ